MEKSNHTEKVTLNLTRRVGMNKHNTFRSIIGLFIVPFQFACCTSTMQIWLKSKHQAGTDVTSAMNIKIRILAGALAIP